MTGSHGGHQAETILYWLRGVSLPIAAVAIMNSVFLITAHSRRNRHAGLRVYTVRILLMVVINCLAALVALWGSAWFPSMGHAVDHVMHFVVEFYESVVIFSFLQFVLACAAGPERLASQFRSRKDTRLAPAGVQAPDILDALGATSVPHRHGRHMTEEHEEASASTDLESNTTAGASGELQNGEAVASDRQFQLELAPSDGKRELKHLPLFGLCCPPWRSGRQMLRWTVSATLSYVVVGIALAVCGLVLLCIPGRIEEKGTVWTVCTTILSVSQGAAVLGLATLAINVREEIGLLRPYGKFLSVKFVVFFAFWQGLLLSALRRAQLFRLFELEGRHCDAECARTVVQNFLICVEMLVASIVHFYVFPTHDYLRLLAQHRMKESSDVSEKALTMPPTLTEVVDVRDIFHTAWQVHLVRTWSWNSDNSAELQVDRKCTVEMQARPSSAAGSGSSSSTAAGSGGSGSSQASPASPAAAVGFADTVGSADTVGAANAALAAGAPMPPLTTGLVAERSAAFASI